MEVAKRGACSFAFLGVGQGSPRKGKAQDSTNIHLQTAEAMCPKNLGGDRGTEGEKGWGCCVRTGFLKKPKREPRMPS